MDTANLQTHVRTLAMLPETDDPVVSCYVALDNRRLKAPDLFEEQIRAVQAGLTGQAQRALEEALQATDHPLKSCTSFGERFVLPLVYQARYMPIAK